MSWRVVVRPEVADDVAKAADWYETRQAGLGAAFVEEVIRVWDELTLNPLLNARRHSRKNVRWRFPARFPYRVIYSVDETERVVVVAAVLHAARHGDEWRQRLRASP